MSLRTFAQQDGRCQSHAVLPFEVVLHMQDGQQKLLSGIHAISGADAIQKALSALTTVEAAMVRGASLA